MSFSSSALSGVCRRSVFFLVASGSGGSARGVLGNEGIERAGLAPSSSPEARELQIEDGDLLGSGDDAGTCGVVDVVVAEDVDGGQSIDEGEDLTEPTGRPASRSRRPNVSRLA